MCLSLMLSRALLFAYSMERFSRLLVKLGEVAWPIKNGANGQGFLGSQCPMPLADRAISSGVGMLIK